MTCESDIVYENGRHWVLRDRSQGLYFVMRALCTHSESRDDVGYPLDEDGLSIAIARCDYLEENRK